MGVAKAGLESASRYLALHLGPKGIRSNLVAAGPLRTMAAKSIPGFEQFEEAWAEPGAAGLGPHRPGAGRPRLPGAAVGLVPGHHRRDRARRRRLPRDRRLNSRPKDPASVARATAGGGVLSAVHPAKGENGTMGYDAVVLLSFGGPEGPDDVLPFLRERHPRPGDPAGAAGRGGRALPHFGGVSPINQQCRDLLAAIRADFAANGVDLPVYWGNRNWHPMLADTVAQMRDDGIRNALGFATSAYGGYSSCRQYYEDIAAARARGRAGRSRDRPSCGSSGTTPVSSSRTPTRSATALARLDPAKRDTTRVVFTAHSVPLAAAAAAGPDGNRYTAQLAEIAGLVAAHAGVDVPYDLVWQSRSGPPQVPWLEPDINDHLAALAAGGTTSVVVSPIGFVSDHLEVVWDLDTEAAATAGQLGLDYVRAATPGVDPRFVAMVRDLVRERVEQVPPPQWRRLGTLPAWDTCPAACCLPTRRS